MSSDFPIGVLTFHRCINYGTYWQARSLLAGLVARYGNAVLIDHASSRVSAAERKCGFHPILPARNRFPDALRYGEKMLKFLRDIARLPRSRRFPLDAPEAMPGFETIVVGSDEVWNLSHPWYGGCPLFFGQGTRSKRLVSYAASFGNYDASAGLDPKWSEQLARFDAISVRDRNSQSLVKAATGAKPPLVLDPCLQFPPPSPAQRWKGPREPFIAVYGHTFSASFARKVRRAATRRRLTLVSIGYRNSWADRQWLSAGPMDFAQAIERSAAVVTNFFHGCVFALRFHRPLVAELSSYRSNKVKDLLESLGAEEHLAMEGAPTAEIERLLGSAPQPAVRDRIAARRSVSFEYLDHAFS